MKENKFLKDISKFFSGAILAQLISFLLSPVLSRLYIPRDFGEFTLYVQVLSVVVILSGSSLFLLLPKFKDKYITKSTLSIVSILSLMVSILLLILGALNIGQEILLPKYTAYLIIGLVLNQIYAYFHFKSISEREFFKNSKAKVVERLGGSSTNLVLGYYGLGGIGLILGNLIGQTLFSIYYIGFKIKVSYEYSLITKWIEIKKYFEKFKKHIIFQSGNHLLEFGFVLLFSILITKMSSISELGYFAFCYKIINTPLNLIADYFSQAALGRISDFSTDSHRRIFILKIGSLLLVPSVISFVIFKFWGPEIFSLIFGKNWEQAGVIAQAYNLAIVSTFFIKSLQYIPNIKDKHEIYTVFSLLTFGMPVAVLFYTNSIGKSFIDSLEILSYGLSILAVIFFLVLLRLFSNKSQELA